MKVNFEKIKYSILNFRGLIKIFTFNGISSIIRIVLGIISNKVSSVFLGPAGFALIGQFSNFGNITGTIASGGIGNGVIKYVSEYYDDTDKREKIINTSFVIVLFCSGIAGIITVLLSWFFSGLLFNTNKYFYVFIIYGIAISLTSLGGIFAALLNGLKESIKLITCSIIINVITVSITIILTIIGRVSGALIAMSISAPFNLLVYYIYLKKSNFRFDKIKLKTDKESLRKILKFSAMAFTTASVVPITQLILRSYVMDNISVNSAGYWQGIIKLSDMYMSVITSSIVIYYLPKLSEIKDAINLRKEIFRGYLFLLPAMFILCCSIFILKDFIINVFFASTFKPMRDLFLPQLIGDFLKIASCLLAYIMVAKAKGKLYIFSEISFGIFYLILALIFLKAHGIIGITYAYDINYFCYLIFLIIVFRKIIFL